jgi:hypothetical protein
MRTKLTGKLQNAGIEGIAFFYYSLPHAGEGREGGLAGFEINKQ